MVCDLVEFNHSSRSICYSVWNCIWRKYRSCYEHLSACPASKMSCFQPQPTSLSFSGDTIWSTHSSAFTYGSSQGHVSQTLFQFCLSYKLKQTNKQAHHSCFDVRCFFLNFTVSLSFSFILVVIFTYSRNIYSQGKYKQHLRFRILNQGYPDLRLN